MKLDLIIYWIDCFIVSSFQAIFSELCKMLDPGKPAFSPKKAKPSVVMFVGLQGEVLR